MPPKRKVAMIALLNKVPQGVLRPAPQPANFRRHKRKQVDDRVWLRSAEHTGRGAVVDVSPQGALLLTEVAAVPGAKVGVRYYPRGGAAAISILATVIRSFRTDSGSYVALRFDPMDRGQQNRLVEYLERRGQLQKWGSQFGL